MQELATYQAEGKVGRIVLDDGKLNVAVVLCGECFSGIAARYQAKATSSDAAATS
jgi:hypothetical protein